MHWVIEAIANVIIEVLNDMLGWIVYLVGDNFSLDIGIPDPDNYKAFQYIFPKEAGENNFIGKLFPGAAGWCTLFMVIAATLIVIFFVFKLYQAFLAPFTDTEAPITTVVRTIIASAGVAFSYSIFAAFEHLFDLIFRKGFMKQYDKTITDNDKIKNFFENYQTQKSDSGSSGDSITHQYGALADNYQAPAESKDAYKLFGQDLIDPKKGSVYDDSLGFLILETILGLALIYSLFRLVLEIYQRYVTIAVLFYMCPLAFAMLATNGSKQIFSNWIQMVFSEFILMCMNLFFVGLFISSFYTKLSTANGYIFDDAQQCIATFLAWIAWIIIGQQIDEYMKSLGLSTAMTGRGLGGAIAGGFTLGRTAVGMTMGAVRGTTGAVKTAARVPEAIQKAKDTLGSWTPSGEAGKIKGFAEANKFHRSGRVAKGDAAENLARETGFIDKAGLAGITGGRENEITDQVAGSGVYAAFGQNENGEKQLLGMAARSSAIDYSRNATPLKSLGNDNYRKATTADLNKTTESTLSTLKDNGGKLELRSASGYPKPLYINVKNPEAVSGHPGVIRANVDGENKFFGQYAGRNGETEWRSIGSSTEALNKYDNVRNSKIALKADTVEEKKN